MKKTLGAYFQDYASYHRTRSNKICHVIGIPLIMVTLLGLLSALVLYSGSANPGTGSMSAYFRLDGGTLLVLAATLWYMSLDWRLATPFFFVITCFYFVGRAMPVGALWTFFVLGWIFQGIGHYVYEKRSPAFFKNLEHILIGPFWLFAGAVGYEPRRASRRAILLTGFWHPTNEMLRPFSRNPKQNPGGWKGENWRGLGFDIHAYFPEFPEGSGEVGVGDFRVDYDSTRADHAKYTALLKPVAIVSFGKGPGPWTLEVNHPDQWGGSGYVGRTTLPLEEIRAAVDRELGKGTTVVNTEGNPGTFLCAFTAMLNSRYADQHASKNDPDRVLAAGFIHVDGDMRPSTAVRATEVTLQALIAHLQAQGA